MKGIWARQQPVSSSLLVPLSPERRTQLGLFRSSPTMRSMPAMPGLAPQGPHATIGVSIQPTTSGPGQAWVRYPGGARPAPGGSLGLGGAIIGFDSTVSEDAAQAIEFAAVSQLEHRILLDFSRPAVREVAPLGCQLLHLTHGRGADHPNHLNESGGVHCRGSSCPNAAHPGVARPGYCVRMAREGSRPGSGASKRC